MVVAVVIVTSFINNSSSVVLAFSGYRESSSAEDKGTASEAKETSRMDKWKPRRTEMGGKRERTLLPTGDRA